MPITGVMSDAASLTLTVTGDYPVPVERLWDAWSDPRQLERFRGPARWAATFTRHDMAVGGRSAYYMTGPDGAVAHGWWRFLAIKRGRSIELEDGFAHENGRPNDALPTTRMTFTFRAVATERMIGTAGPGTVNEMTLTPLTATPGRSAKTGGLIAGETIKFALIGPLDLAVVTTDVSLWFGVPGRGSLVLLSGGGCCS
jgi:uncharacterized protein YndB with AHSA1/START domain